MKHHHRDIIIKSIDGYINKYKCNRENCEMIYFMIYKNNMFVDKKEFYFFQYLKKMIDFYFEEQELIRIQNNINKGDGSIFDNMFFYITNFTNDKYNLYFIEKIISKKLYLIMQYSRIPYNISVDFNQNYYTSYTSHTNFMYFLVNKYDLIKTDNKLDLLFDNYIFEYFGKSSICDKNFNICYYICFNYIYKIYINRVNNIINTILDKEELDKSLLDLKIRFRCVSPANIKDIKNTPIYEILSILNKKIDEKNDIFRNFDKKYASYYPIEIITLYNFYMHNFLE
jgi:hypothetical protein